VEDPGEEDYSLQYHPLRFRRFVDASHPAARVSTLSGITRWSFPRTPGTPPSSRSRACF
jgi:hypothetical protein